jgi:hypothetical protein
VGTKQSKGKGKDSMQPRQHAPKLLIKAYSERIPVLLVPHVGQQHGGVQGGHGLEAWVHRAVAHTPVPAAARATARMCGIPGPPPALHTLTGYDCG